VHREFEWIYEAMMGYLEEPIMASKGSAALYMPRLSVRGAGLQQQPALQKTTLTRFASLLLMKR